MNELKKAPRRLLTDALFINLYKPFIKTIFGFRLAAF